MGSFKECLKQSILARFLQVTLLTAHFLLLFTVFVEAFACWHFHNLHKKDKLIKDKRA